MHISNHNCQELETGVTHCKQRMATLSNRSSRRGKAKGETKCEDHHESKKISQFLIDSLPIRNQPKLLVLSVNLDSNREKSGIFQEVLWIERVLPGEE